MFTVTKHYRDLPAAHRQPNHEGHCRFIHGHNWGFDITFGCDKLDKNGFVTDLGDLEWLKVFLKAKFDHTLLLNRTDPFLATGSIDSLGVIVVVENCGVEGLAKYVFDYIDSKLPELPENGRVFVAEVTCWEDSKNCATYRP